MVEERLVGLNAVVRLEAGAQPRISWADMDGHRRNSKPFKSSTRLGSIRLPIKLLVRAVNFSRFDAARLKLAD